METLLAHCSAVFSQHGGLFAVFFLGGLTGGFAHCLAMCGPMVAGQSACASRCSKGGTERASWGYHLGRLTTYSGLGFFAALFGRQIAALSIWPVLSSAMLFVAGAMFIASSLPQASHSFCNVTARTSYMRGALMGFMPCGLLYAALMMAATLANPFAGMLAMGLFTLGTIPALLIASSSVELLGRKWRPAVARAGRVVMAFNGASLLVMATKLVG